MGRNKWGWKHWWRKWWLSAQHDCCAGYICGADDTGDEQGACRYCAELWACG